MTQKELLNPPTVVTLHCILLMDPGKEHMGSKGACNLPCRFKKKHHWLHIIVFITRV